MSVIVVSELDTLLNELVGNSPLSSTLLVHLFQNNVPFVNTTVLTSLIEANYSTYAALALPGWGAAAGGGAGTSISNNGTVSFAPGVLVTPQICYGWYVTDNAGALLGGDTFPAPLTMGGTTTLLTITPSLSLS
jgi:hypothetical protein